MKKTAKSEGTKVFTFYFGDRYMPTYGVFIVVPGTYHHLLLLKYQRILRRVDEIRVE